MSLLVNRAESGVEVDGLVIGYDRLQTVGLHVRVSAQQGSMQVGMLHSRVIVYDRVS